MAAISLFSPQAQAAAENLRKPSTQDIQKFKSAFDPSFTIVNNTDQNITSIRIEGYTSNNWGDYNENTLVIPYNKAIPAGQTVSVKTYYGLQIFPQFVAGFAAGQPLTFLIIPANMPAQAGDPQYLPNNIGVQEYLQGTIIDEAGGKALEDGDMFVIEKELDPTDGHIRFNVYRRLGD